jgi:hypothetical protein
MDLTVSLAGCLVTVDPGRKLRWIAR